jgi:enoyl-[acyl-carrier-protein] reductase (NADH)
LNLGEEISYAYQIAKALVEDEVNKVGVHDSEEIRKSVREMHRFLESALKMQERLHGVDEARRFVESVLQILEDVDPALRELAVVRLLDSQI